MHPRLRLSPTDLRSISMGAAVDAHELLDVIDETERRAADAKKPFQW